MGGYQDDSHINYVARRYASNWDYTARLHWHCSDLYMYRSMSMCILTYLYMHAFIWDWCLIVGIFLAKDMSPILWFLLGSTISFPSGSGMRMWFYIVLLNNDPKQFLFWFESEYAATTCIMKKSIHEIIMKNPIDNGVRGHLSGLPGTTLSEFLNTLRHEPNGGHSQAIFSNSFSGMKIIVFWFQFH